MKIKQTIKYFTIIFTVTILSLFVSGCQEDSSEDVVSNSSQVSADEVVSEEYQQRLKNYTKELNFYMSHHNQVIRDKTLSSDEAVKIMTEGVIFTSEHKTLNPTSETERVIDEYVFNMSYYFKQMLEYSLKLVNTRDKTYAQLAYDAQENYNHEISIMRELLVKYSVNN